MHLLPPLLQPHGHAEGHEEGAGGLGGGPESVGGVGGAGVATGVGGGVKVGVVVELCVSHIAIARSN
jgi:hypothetical protein